MLDQKTLELWDRAVIRGPDGKPETNWKKIRRALNRQPKLDAAEIMAALRRIAKKP